MRDNWNRREFILRSALFLAVPSFISFARRAFGEEAEVKVSDPTAQSLTYCPNAKKASKKVCPLRAGKDKAKQFCRECQFYAKTKGSGASELGMCQLISSGLVRGDGWCSSWVKKA